MHARPHSNWIQDVERYSCVSDAEASMKAHTHTHTRTYNHARARAYRYYCHNLDTIDMFMCHASKYYFDEFFCVLIYIFSSLEVDINAADDEGKSCVHHVVAPTAFASYENFNILERLHQEGASLDLKDVNG